MSDVRDDREPERFLASSTHPGSGRSAIVAAEGASLWLYLTDPGTLQPSVDCWLYNLGPTPSQVDRAARERGEPPPAITEVVDGRERYARPLDGADVRFGWSADGHAASAWVHAELAGFVVGGERRGYSLHLSVPGPWGLPLDLVLYRRLFGADVEI